MSRGFRHQIKENKDLRISFVLLVLMCVLFILMLVSLLFQCAFLQVLFSVILIVVVIISIRQTRRERQNPTKQLGGIKEQSDELVFRFLLKANLTPHDLGLVLKSIGHYRQDRKDAQHTFTDRAFELLGGGIFITGLNCLFQISDESKSISMELPSFLCLSSILVMPLACAVWEIYDSLQSTSLARTEAMIKAIECFEMSY